MALRRASPARLRRAATLGAHRESRSAEGAEAHMRSAIPSVHDATDAFERWLKDQLPDVDKKGFDKKHEKMDLGAFEFLRATFYRWMQRWPEIAEELDGAPRVLAVGDLHIENFGTWRDSEGRLVWGINDFD